MNVENMIVAALWLGPCKPSIDVLLPSVLSKIDLLHTNGIEFSTPHGKNVLRVKIVAAVFDFPAKAMALILFSLMVTMDAHIVKTEASINATGICIYQQNHILLKNLVILMHGHEEQKKF